MPELRLVDVRYRHAGAERDVFAPLSATASAGVTWLRGRNGAGKTTLLELVAGLRSPAGGTIALDDRPIERTDVVYAPSTPAVFDELDALEHASLVVDLWALDGAAADAYDRRFARLADALRIPTSGMRVESFSAGMREKLALSLLLALDASVVLLDEPFTASDSAALAAGQDILGTLALDRVVVVTSHLPAVVEPLTPTVLDLDAAVAR